MDFASLDKQILAWSRKLSTKNTTALGANIWFDERIF